MTRTACLNSIYELAKRDERVVFIGSDLSPNTLPDFQRDFPNRFFMEGINEQNCVGMAAGLAKEGFIPYVNTIATFITRRAYEQVAMDICLHNLPVRLIGNGGGLLYAPLGATHCAIEDIAIMRALPNMAVVNCADSAEMLEFMPQTLDYPGPMYIRLGRDNDLALEKEFIGRAKILLIGTGIMTPYLQRARKLIDIPANIYHARCIKPLTLDLNVAPYDLIVTAEEGIASGGLGTAVMELLADNRIYTPVLRLGLPDAFPHHYGEREDLLDTYGLTPEKIAQRIKEAYARISD
jgi:transketolase